MHQRLMVGLMSGWESTSLSRLPLSLRLMGFLFIGYGLWSIGRFVLSILPGDEGELGSGSPSGITFSLGYGSILWEQLFVGLLQINIGTQLWERDRFWRFVVMAWLACNAAAIAVLGVLGMFTKGPDATVAFKYASTLYWQVSGNSPTGIIIYIVIICLNLFWLGLQWWALDRPEVRKLFINTENTAVVGSASVQ
jgi:hypothetical protein